MSGLPVWLLRAAFGFLGGGILLGASFALNRALGPAWRPLHAELNLWGWATLLIYGFAYHMLPRFTGRPLWECGAQMQATGAVAGVALAVLGWLLLPLAPGLGRALALGGGLLQAGAAVLFAWLAADMLLRRDPHG